MKIFWVLSAALFLSCHPVSLSSAALGEGRVYRATTTPEPAWYEPGFRDDTWERRANETFTQRGELYLRQRFDLGVGADAVTDVYLNFASEPNFETAYLNGFALVPDESLQGAGHSLGFRLPAGTLRAEDNLLAISFAPEAAPQLPKIEPVFPEDGARITRGPYLLHPTKEGITVAFETQKPCYARVQYGDAVINEPLFLLNYMPLSAASNEQSTPGAAKTYHQLRISSLSAATRYPYQVQCSSEAGYSGTILSEGTFTTAPLENSAVTIVALAPGPELFSFATAAAQAKALSPDLTLVLGGLLPANLDKFAWDDLFRAGYGLFRDAAVVPAMSARHSGLGRPRGPAAIFALPDSAFGAGRAFSEEYGAAHLIVIDADTLLNPEMKRWLIQDAAAAKARGQQVIVALSHTALGAYRAGGGRQGEASFSVELLHDVDLDLVIATGDHLYERGSSKSGVQYLLLGEPTTERQFVLLEVSAAHIWVRTYGEGGVVTDEAKLGSDL